MTTNNSGSQVITLPNKNQGNEPLPTLPAIGGELETFFRVARQIEAMLQQERAQSKKYREEIRALQHQVQDFQQKDAELRSELAVHQKTEQEQTDQLRDMSRHLESLNNDRKKTEIDLEISKAKLESFHQREDAFKLSLQSYQTNEKSHRETVEALNNEIQTLKNELRRYQAAWGQVLDTDRQAKRVLTEWTDVSRRLEEMKEILSAEKNRVQILEEAVAKEKREKQVALSCLHTTEARLAQVTRELEHYRDQKIQNVEDQTLQIRF